MGEVFLARDRETGQQVAVKRLGQRRPLGEARFEREALVLASLDHPGIVRYTAHGVTPEGEPYLVMEWLEGNDLARLLEHRRLTVGETLTLGLRVADALAAMHAQGAVHRDVKPGNIFLVHGKIEQAKLIDLGLVRSSEITQVTGTGTAVGTLGYMAPEQARSEGVIDARADVFSLGCVLFQCLTGAPAFRAERLVALLTKILFEEAPPPSERCPGLPAELDALVARMLRKAPNERPRDCAEVAAALRGIVSRGGDAPSSALTMALTTAERRLISVVLIETEPGGSEAPPDWSALREIAEVHGGRAEQLADGTMAVIFTGDRVATDQAAQAARCALSLRARAPGRRIALATSQRELSNRTQVSDVIDRTAKMLGGRASGWPISIDDVTAGLLRSRFDVRLGDDGTLELHGQSRHHVRTLLGRQTACVGRGSCKEVCVSAPNARC